MNKKRMDGVDAKSVLAIIHADKNNPRKHTYPKTKLNRLTERRETKTPIENEKMSVDNAEAKKLG